MNSVFVTERATRDNPRAFVPYYDLVEDWRAAMSRAAKKLGIEIGDLTAPHAVDEFITPSLNRSSDAWDGLHVPDALKELAEQTLGGRPRARHHTLRRDRRWPSSTGCRRRTPTSYASPPPRSPPTRKIAAVSAVRADLQQRLDKKNQRIQKLRDKLRDGR